MNIILLLTIAIFLIMICSAKLIYKTTYKPKSQIADVVAKDQNGAYSNYFYSKRTVRAADEKIVVKNITNNTKDVQDKVLVKKPIPKYHEVNSDEDYQGRFKLSENRDSVEREDEDFNINDYDFGVNHDEFTSGRKPLEPRIKLSAKRPRPNKLRSNSKVVKASKPKLPRSLIQRKVIFPKKPVEKVTRNAADKMKEEDYDQEFSTSTQSIEDTTHEKDVDDESDEIEDSKEFVGPASIRTVRSPWDLGIGHYVEKLGERSINMMTKLLSHLPIFPQVPNAKKIDYDVFSLSEPVKNPMMGG